MYKLFTDDCFRHPHRHRGLQQHRHQDCAENFEPMGEVGLNVGAVYNRDLTIWSFAWYALKSFRFFYTLTSFYFLNIYIYIIYLI